MANSTQPDTRSFMQMLPETVAETVWKSGSLVRYETGQLIHSRGDKTAGICIVKSGAALAGVFGEDGSFVMTTILGPGETFGEFTLFANLPRTHDITASMPSEIYHISKARFQKIYDAEPAVSQALLSSALIRTHILLEMLDAIRRLPMLERTAKILFLLLRSAGDGEDFHCRQSDLAHAIGVSRMTLSKSLKQLERLGLIELGYGRIRLRDRERTESWIARHCDISLF